MIRRIRQKSCLPLAALAVGWLCGCGPTLEEGNDARIRVTPTQQLAFSRVSVGEERALPFVITSVGRDDLTIRRIEWNGASSVTLRTDGQTFPHQLQSRASLPVNVRFAPTNDAPAPNGTVKIYSNDQDHPIYELDVIAQQLSAQIHVVPSAEERLIIGQTDVGKTTTKSVVITNVGDLPLEISNIALSASKDFEFTTSTLPVTLPAHTKDALTVNVAFTPNAIGAQEGNLIISSNDPTHPTYTLPISANSDTPCLQIAPSIVEFSPAVSIGTTSTQTVTLTSCSSVPLIITDVAKISGDNVFVHELTGGNHSLQNGESAQLKISYTPTKSGSNRASYVIMNNDPLNANATLSVLGSASENTCPTAEARARLSTSSTWAKTLDVAPLDTVHFDASLSSDKESNTLTYFWQIQQSPKDSTAQLQQDAQSASLFIDLAGNYEVCLSVEDSAGMMSCNTDCITISAVPRETIHAQLVWHAPADKTIGDADGVDLDLHFLSLPDGKWGDTGNPQLNNGSDCFFKNQTPVWSVGQLNEEPSLDRDDKAGDGPENINLDQPNPCRWYAIGVHDYNDNAFGIAYATVRIYINGKMRFEKANIPMLQTAAFKQVAWLFWDGSNGRFYESDFSVDNDNDWIGKTPTVPDDVLKLAEKSAPQCFSE